MCPTLGGGAQTRPDNGKVCASANLKSTVVSNMRRDRRRQGECSHMWLLCGGRTIGFALSLAPAVQQTVKGGCPPRSLHRSWTLQIHQVVVGLAHAGVLALMMPPEKELCTLLEEAAWGEEAKEKNC